MSRGHAPEKDAGWEYNRVKGKPLEIQHFQGAVKESMGEYITREKRGVSRKQNPRGALDIRG